MWARALRAGSARLVRPSARLLLSARLRANAPPSYVRRISSRDARHALRGVCASSTSVGLTSGPLLDLRSTQDFEERHLIGASSFPLDELAARLYELPPKYSPEPLQLLGSAPDLQAAHTLLSESGWKVQEPMLDSDSSAVWELAPVQSGGRGVRIWKPSEFLEVVFPRVKEALQTSHAECPLQPGQRRVAIDVGCGSGRDMVFMALELGASWEVIGIDNHTKALQRAVALGEREGVKVETIDRDLRKAGMSDLRADLVHGSRFLARELFPEMRDSVLQPGGVFIWSHFLEGCEKLAPPRRPSRQLQEGELRETFVEEAGFLPIHDEESTMSTRFEVVPAAFFAAQKPWR